MASGRPIYQPNKIPKILRVLKRNSLKTYWNISFRCNVADEKQFASCREIAFSGANENTLSAVFHDNVIFRVLEMELGSSRRHCSPFDAHRYDYVGGSAQNLRTHFRRAAS